jgi:hypothetical protein
MNWKYCILIGLIFLIIGFIIGLHPAFESIQNIATGISFAIVLGLVGLAFKLSELIRALNAKKEERKRTHVNESLKPELEIMAESKIDFADDLKLYIHSKRVINSDIPAKRDYSKEIEAHLLEYKNAYKLKKEREINIEEYNKIIQPLLAAVSEKIINTFKQKSPLIAKWSRVQAESNTSPMESNDPKTILKEVRRIIRFHLSPPHFPPLLYQLYKTEGEIESGWHLHFEGNQWKLIANFFVIESRTETEITEIKQAIDTVLKEVSTEQKFNNIIKYYKCAIYSHKLFME